MNIYNLWTVCAKPIMPLGRMILWNIEHKSSIGENRLILVARKVTLKRWRWIKLAESEFWVLTGNATLFNFAKTRRKGVDFCLFASGSRDRAACVAQLRTKKPWHDKTKSPIRFAVNISLTPKSPYNFALLPFFMGFYSACKCTVSLSDRCPAQAKRSRRGQ